MKLIGERERERDKNEKLRRRRQKKQFALSMYECVQHTSTDQNRLGVDVSLILFGEIATADLDSYI
jgi:hypothetical protein